ncbi:DUF2252 domain-containing protein [Solirubrobacter ginsenosidimutans]|uniref:DUF2252 domain-containing protein n=1 Tax=Solirubrobacter ginsenosidimutans TaxID=490573 RepID=A0A9X3S2S9_9ACTN|nr:DUF2252 family protein [Solirubrobacter ginsenosidimutans]MDA0158983.1 DUF2252 domain-containing protein [Solirubrobacter ginsenosidimutans]
MPRSAHAGWEPPSVRRDPVAVLEEQAQTRRLVFGVNDFDETLRGPFEWDVRRLVASFAVGDRSVIALR